MTVVRAPVSFSLNSSAPIRGSVAAPPYTLVNLSTDFTAWIADNPGMTVGQGTPLYPGTSIKWTRPGDLWMIGEGTMQVVVSYDVEDWQPNPAAIAAAVLNSGVIVIDNPAILYSDTDTITDTVDVSRYQAVMIKITGPATPIVNLAVANLVWSDSAGNQITVQRVEFTPSGSGTYAWNALVPCIGARLHIIKTGFGTQNITIIGSNRVVPEVAQFPWQPIAPSGFDSYLLMVRGTALAGAGQFYVLAPWFGEIEINCTFHSTAPNNSILSVEMWSKPLTAFVAVEHIQFVPGGPFASSAVKRIAVAGNGVRIQVFNNMAVNMTFDLEVNPLTGVNWS